MTIPHPRGASYALVRPVGSHPNKRSDAGVTPPTVALTAVSPSRVCLIAHTSVYHRLMRIYADSNIGFVDSAIIALAERLNSTRIVTLDRRHFTFVRPRHCAHFDLLP